VEMFAGNRLPIDARWEYALRTEDLVDGDLLVTSGTDEIFPRGLPVGKLAHIKKSGFGLYQHADVILAIDVTKLEEVLVLLSPIGRPAPEASATP